MDRTFTQSSEQPNPPNLFLHLKLKGFTFRLWKTFRTLIMWVFNQGNQVITLPVPMYFNLPVLERKNKDI